MKKTVLRGCCCRTRRGRYGLRAQVLFCGTDVRAGSDVSERTSKVLQAKIDAIKAAETSRSRQTERHRGSPGSLELESYVLYGIRDDIPARVDSIDVQLTDGAVAADTKLTFPSTAPAIPLWMRSSPELTPSFMKGKACGVGEAAGVSS